MNLVANLLYFLGQVRVSVVHLPQEIFQPTVDAVESRDQLVTNLLDPLREKISHLSKMLVKLKGRYCRRFGLRQVGSWFLFSSSFFEILVLSIS